VNRPRQRRRPDRRCWPLPFRPQEVPGIFSSLIGGLLARREQKAEQLE
jgi:hypothetical protein